MTEPKDFDASLRVTRREALGMLSAGVAAAVLPSIAFSAKEPHFPKGAVIRTLLKDLPPSTLGKGATLFHEHLSIDLPPIGPPPKTPPPPQATADVDYIIGEIKTAGSEGVSCIVDGGHPDMGRKLDYLKKIATSTNVHIVASGGFYMEGTYPPDVATKSEDLIADDLVREASANRYGAFGEIGESANAAMNDEERKVFRAVGKAHLRTNLPIFTHNAYGTGPNVPKDAGLHQLDVLESVGVKPQHVVIGHTCCLDDPTAEIIKRIAKRGAFVGFDRVTGGRVPDDKKVIMIQAFLEAGYTDKLLICSDFTGRRTAARPGYGNTLTVFIPMLRQAGVKEDTLHAIMVDNPRRFLAIAPKKA
jgi:phosphotriesterase-related protein